MVTLGYKIPYLQIKTKAIETKSFMFLQPLLFPQRRSHHKISHVSTYIFSHSVWVKLIAFRKGKQTLFHLAKSPSSWCFAVGSHFYTKGLNSASQADLLLVTFLHQLSPVLWLESCFTPLLFSHIKSPKSIKFNNNNIVFPSFPSLDTL